MMIKAHYTIVAHIAMSGPLRPKDHASLTELQPVKHVFVDIQVKNSIFFVIYISVFSIYSPKRRLIVVL